MKEGMQKSNLSDAGVVVTLFGGLGNQLFQYAMGRALSLRTNQPLILDLTWFDRLKYESSGTTTARRYALGHFNLEVKTQSVGLPIVSLNGLVGRILRRCIRSLPRRHMGYRVYIERRFGFDLDAFSLHGAIWLDGYWQSYKYFEEISSLLRNELSSLNKLSQYSQRLLDNIARCDAICLHIRRGDYITNQKAAAKHGLCNMDYYKRGLEHILFGLKNPHCFIFSDEPDWARSNLQLPVSSTVVDINDSYSAHEDLWLMSACTHFVIANSSLSWWGAWLSTAPNKIVVAPKAWFLDSRIDTSDLIPAEWIRL